MNCEAYILQTGSSGKFTLYPQNISNDVLRDICDDAPREDDMLVIKRTGDMIYYVYLRQLDGNPKKRIGIAVGLNLTVIDDIAGLHRFFNKAMRYLAHHFGIAQYSKTRAEYSSTSGTINYIGAVGHLRHRFNNMFAETGEHAGAINFTSTPEKETWKCKADGSYAPEHYITGESEHASPSVKIAIERGNTLIVTSEVSDEKMLAAANKLCDSLKSENDKLTKENDTLKSEKDTLTKRVATLEQNTSEEQNRRERAENKLDACQKYISSVNAKIATEKAEIISDSTKPKQSSLSGCFGFLASFSIVFIALCSFTKLTEDRFDVRTYYWEDYYYYPSLDSLQDSIIIICVIGLCIGALRLSRQKVFKNCVISYLISACLIVLCSHFMGYIEEFTIGMCRLFLIGTIAMAIGACIVSVFRKTSKQT